MTAETLMPWKDDVDAKSASITVGTTTITFPVVVTAMVQEMRDQSDLKKPHRQAILRKTHKQLKAMIKQKDSLAGKQLEEYLFTGFIIWIDQQIGTDHIGIRDGVIDVEQKATVIVDQL